MTVGATGPLPQTQHSCDPCVAPPHPAGCGLDEIHHWPGPQTIPAPVHLPVPIGVDQDGGRVAFQFTGRHTLYAGAIASGTTTGMRVALRSLAARSGGQMRGISLMWGARDLESETDSFTHLATTRPHARALLHELASIARYRAGHLADPPAEIAVLTKHQFLVVADLRDIPMLGEQALEDWRHLLTEGARLGISIITKTSRPEALNSIAPHTAFANIACFRTTRAAATNAILGPGAAADGWNAHRWALALPGMFLPRSPEHTSPRRARGYWTPASPSPQARG